VALMNIPANVAAEAERHGFTLTVGDDGNCVSAAHSERGTYTFVLEIPARTAAETWSEIVATMSAEAG
jgi:hypothetical protein